MSVQVKDSYPDITITLNVNGKDHTVTVKPYERLLDVLRNKLNLISVKEGCGRGECGACAVIMDGKLVASCMVLAVQARGKKILTVEGITLPGKLHAIQKALLDTYAMQCGFCFSGVIMAMKALLDKNLNPSEDEIREALSGNLCRCGSYLRFIKATKLAAEYIRKGQTYFELKG